MADYKRMVSYMYQYENGVKRRNVGFARVEAKNGQCKITLHMQLLGQSDSIFPTYLFHREDNHMELIYLGDSVLKNQVMDSRLVANDTNIMGSGYNLSDIGGLLIFLNNNTFFATEWEDKPIVAKEVLEALKPKQKPPEAEPKEAPAGNPAEQGAADMEEANKATQETIAEEITETLSLEEELRIPKYKLPRGWKTVEMFQKPLAAAENGRRRNATNAAGKETVLQPAQEETQKEQILQQSAEPKQEEHQKDDRPKKEESKPGGIPDQAVNQKPEDKLQGGKAPADENPGENLMAASLTMDTVQEDPPTAKHFFENYPRIYPFEDNEILLCVKIEPKDIGLLPKELWALSNNSFLMHGYYCYHHLIFAKKKDGEGSCYIIGIPGIYHNREQFMARMFGLESFKSIRKRDLRQGDFGYWYLQVNF